MPRASRKVILAVRRERMVDIGQVQHGAESEDKRKFAQTVLTPLRTLPTCQKEPSRLQPRNG